MSDRKGLQLDIELGPTNALILGGVRTLLGASFGLVFYLLLASGLVVLTPPLTDHKVEFYAVLGFIAGFSERFIPDTLGVVGALVGVVSDRTT
jgi:hypothetical protein